MPVPTFNLLDQSQLVTGKPVKASQGLAFYLNLLAAFGVDPSTLSPGVAPLLQAGCLASASVATANLQDGCVTAPKLAGAVTQSALGTTLASGSQAVSSSSASPSYYLVSLGGGQYGFFPNYYASLAGLGALDDFTVSLAEKSAIQTGSMGDVLAVLLTAAGAGQSGTFYWEQLYVHASPPYDLGDGQIPLFVFAEVDKDGKVLASWIAQDPPWAKHIKTTGYDSEGQPVSERTLLPPGELLPSAALTALRQNQKTITVLTPKAKNAFIHKAPHPFLGERKKIVLLDPPATADLLSLHQNGYKLHEALAAGHIKIDNTELKRATPPGVTAHAFTLA